MVTILFYILFFLIFLFLIYLTIQAINRGIKAKKKNKKD